MVRIASSRSVLGLRHVHAFPRRLQAQRARHLFGLRRIGAAAEIERERADVVGVAAERCRGMAGQQPHRRAVHAARKRHRDRLARRHRGQPRPQRAVRRVHVGGARLVHVAGALRDRRLEEPPVARHRIRAAHLIQLHEVVRRNHAGVRRLELPADPLALAPLEDGVDAVGDHQERAVVHLRHEVAQRHADGAGETHRLPLARGAGEMTARRRQRRGVAGANGRKQRVAPGRGVERRAHAGEVDQPFDAFEHEERILPVRWVR